MYTKFILVLVALPLLVSSLPTHCDRWKDSWEFRCAKDNYDADSIHIRNIVDSNVSFKIGKWMSEIHKPSIKYSDIEHQLPPGGSHDEDFMEVYGINKFNEMFIYACKREGKNIKCIDVVTPSVN